MDSVKRPRVIFTSGFSWTATSNGINWFREYNLGRYCEFGFIGIGVAAKM